MELERTAVAIEMATILLAWNPKRYPWGSLMDELKAVRRQRQPGFSWSVGHSRRPQSEDRAFLVRLGSAPKGIVAAGWIGSPPYEDAHWNPDLARDGKKSLYIKLILDYLSSEPVIPWSVLTSGVLSQFNWSTRMSGITIPPATARALEEEWAKRLPGVGQPVGASSAEFHEGRRREVRLSRQKETRRLGLLV